MLYSNYLIRVHIVQYLEQARRAVMNQVAVYFQVTLLHCCLLIASLMARRQNDRMFFDQRLHSAGEQPVN